MWDDHLTEDQRREVHRFKRSYWTQEGIGVEYQYCAHQPEPLTRAKNVVEISMMRSYASGHRILDAGAGTGRFTLPLLRMGFEVTALDISREMLTQGIKTARKKGERFPAIAGDIERLPFPDAAFDTVISVTVLRHFPGWPCVLDEYVRVVKPGGRIVFDMASGDQAAYLDLHSPPEQDTKPFDPEAYDAALTVKQLEAAALQRGLSIAAVIPSDFLSNNPLLLRGLGVEKDAFLDALRDVLKPDAAIGLYERVARYFFPLLSPAFTPSWFAVLDKAPAQTPFRPAYRTMYMGSLSSDPEEGLCSILTACAGEHYPAYFDDCRQLASLPETQPLIAFVRNQILPSFPLEALLWEAR